MKSGGERGGENNKGHERGMQTTTDDSYELSVCELKSRGERGGANGEGCKRRMQMTTDNSYELSVCELKSGGERGGVQMAKGRERGVQTMKEHVK